MHRAILVGFISLAALLAAPAIAAKGKGPKCAQDETSFHGKCVKACPTDGSFRDPDSCECPAGFGKILSGDGGGQCSRLRCPAGAEIAADRDCDCLQGYEKRKTAKGKVRCEIRQAQAK